MQTLPIGKIKANPNNPRTIKDDKFFKLVQSLKDLPEMAKVRPVVVNQDMVVLGGNMRLKAMKEAGCSACKRLPDSSWEPLSTTMIEKLAELACFSD